MRISVAQLNYHIGNFEQNTEKIVQAIRRAQVDQADLVVFSELAICGYPPRDFLEFSDFLELCNESIEAICAASQGIAVLVGAPSKNPVIEGKDLHNSALFIKDGKVEKRIHKTLLPTYDIFDEYRYFEPNTVFETIDLCGTKIAVTICEDIWNIGNENPMYTISPLEEMKDQGAELIINLSASPFSHTQIEQRHAVVKANAERYQLPLIYVNHVGAQTELIFDGGTLVLNNRGKIYDELARFEEDFKTFELTSLYEPLQEDRKLNDSRIAQMHDALVIGIRDYFSKLGFTKAILGLSGGIDSALVMCLAAEALGAENVKGVLLPSRYSSDHSIADAIALAENLGAQHQTVSIEVAYQAFANTMAESFAGLKEDVTEENLQARSRAVILMAFSNKQGYILLNTSNKSESAVGYGTLYGDMCGGISVIGDLYKVEVYEMARYINRNKEIIPEHIITKAPSAELRPDQKDSDSLPPYEILDSVLQLYIEERLGPREIEDRGFDPALVKRVLRLVNMSEWKRYQQPPILRVSPKAFGMGRRVPIVARYLT